jgi:hypothetical protein
MLRDNFDGHLENQNLGVPDTPMIALSKVGTSRKSSLSWGSEITFGLPIFQNKSFFLALEARALPIQKLQKKSVTYQGYFQTIMPGILILVTQEMHLTRKLSNTVGGALSIGIHLNEALSLTSHFLVKRSKLTYQSTLFEAGTRVSSDIKTKHLYTFETDIGVRYYFFKSWALASTMGYHWSQSIKFSDIHPQTTINYKPSYTQHGWHLKFGITYEF